MKRFALFVGVNNYPGNRLKYAKADAEVLYKRFSEYYDETRLLVDKQASKETIIREMKALKRKASPGDLLLFFYSGHGHDGYYERILDIPVYDSRGRFCPTADGLHTNAIAAATEKKGVHRLFILDCCRVDIRDDGASGGRKSAGKRPSAAALKAPGYLERQDVSEIVQPAILSSSSPGQMSQELWGSDRHGLFTKAIIETLDSDDVHGFDDFRNSIGANMQSLKERLRRENPADEFTQVASVEGPIDINIPFWPPWEIEKSGHRRRRGNEERQDIQRNGSRHSSPLPRQSRVATVKAVASAFEDAEMLSRCFYLKSEFIPDDKLAHACKSMEVRCASSRVLALYDDTWLGGSREGFVIAPEGIYAKNIREDPMFFKWGTIDTLGYESNAIHINGATIAALDCYLSMEAKKAVYNGIIKVEEQISGEKFGNSDEDEDDEDEDDETDDIADDVPDEDDEPEPDEEDGDEDDGDEDGDEDEDSDCGSDDGDEWSPDPELLRQVNALLRKH